MFATAKRVFRVESADGIPDGEYAGTWGGYKCQFETPHGSYEAELDVGIRGVNIPCVVKVVFGRITVSTSPGGPRRAG